MIKIAKRNLEWLPTLLAVVFLCFQVAADLYLPTITSDLVDKGILKQDISYIWAEGGSSYTRTDRSCRKCIFSFYPSNEGG